MGHSLIGGGPPLVARAALPIITPSGQERDYLDDFDNDCDDNEHEILPAGASIDPLSPPYPPAERDGPSGATRARGAVLKCLRRVPRHTDVQARRRA